MICGHSVDCATAIAWIVLAVSGVKEAGWVE